MPGILGADPVLYFLGASALLKYALLSLWHGKRPANAEHVGEVTDLRLYPVKSARYIAAKELTCNYSGFQNGINTDRHWVVAENDGNFVSGKVIPCIATIVPSFHGKVLHLDAPNMDTLKVDIAQVEASKAKMDIMIYGVTTKGLDCGAEAEAWMSAFIDKRGRRFKLIYSPPWLEKRSVIAGTQKFLGWTKVAKEVDMIAYADNVHALIMTEEAVADLNQRLSSPVTMDWFRPNIVTKGRKAYDEDTWKEVYIGDVKFTTIKLCGRCAFVNVNPETGVADPKQEVLKTLRSYRLTVPDYGDAPCLGINLVTDWEGTIKLGDPVYVIRGDSTQLPD